MRDTVDILSYWIKVLRKIVEFQEIAKVEDIEFLRLYGATQQIEDNMYIALADEYGIERLEKVAGITPETGDTLETRRTRLYVYWNDRKPYTLGELYNRLESIIGSDDFEINCDNNKYYIEINTHVGGYGIFDEISKLLDYYLPANLVLELQNSITGTGTAGVYFGTGTVTAMSYTITNDVNGSYPLTQGMYLAAPMGIAESYKNTNDINATYPVSNSMYLASPVSVSAAVTATNDIEGVYSSDMSLNGAVGVSTAANVTVTNDINSTAELSEAKTVGEAVSTSAVITISE